MYKTLSILCLLFLIPAALFSQTTLRLCISLPAKQNATTTYPVQILVQGKNILPGAQISATDSCLTLPHLKNTVYQCTITGTGERYAPQNFSTDTIPVNTTLRIRFRPDVKELEMATVKNNQPHFRGDTLVIPVDSIKTRPHSAATELMNKVPGIDSDAAGNISVNGKKVDEITVNGQALFGGNAKATLEAIKSNMVQQLEIVEKENSSGQTRAYMNLKLKKNREKGWYRNIGQHAGNEGTWKTDLRLNHIAPGRLMNIFANSNNLNEKALSEQNLLTFTNLFKRDINAYSITAQQTQSAVSFSSNEDNLFADDNRDLGRNKNHSAGISFSRVNKKNETTAFMIAEQAKQNLEEDFTSRKFLSTVNRLDSSSGELNRKRNSAFGNLTHSIRINDNNNFKTGITLLLAQSERQRMQEQQNSLLDATGLLLNRSTLSRNDNEDGNRFAIIHQTSWLHRFKKPAKVFSAYVKWSVYGNKDERRYINRVSPPPGNDQLVETNRAYRQVEVQAIQSFPLNRKWLLELQAVHQSDHVRINQQAWSFTGPDDQFLPGISAMPFTTTMHRTQALANMLYKTTNTSIIGGLGVGYWNARRSRNDVVLFQPDAVKLLPALLVKRRFKRSGSTLTLRYKAGWSDPLEAQLNPLEDSASLQQVNGGNPYLESVLRHSTSLGYTHNVSIGQVLSFSLQHSLIDNPVVSSTQLLPAPAIKNTYTQYGTQQQLTGSLFWLDYKSSRPFSYFTSIVAGWQRAYAINNGNPFPYRAFLGSFYLGGRYKVNKKMELDLRWQTIYNAYGSATESNRNDLRSSIRLRADNSFKKEYYSLVTLDFQLNGSNNPERRVSPFISAELSKYFSKDNKWRLTAAVKNLLNLDNSFSFSQSNTQQTINRYNNLPRVVTLGVVAYFERWK